MPVAPKQLPRLAELLLDYDWNDVRARFQTTLNIRPEDVFPIAGDRYDACYALIYKAYRERRIDDYLTALRTISQQLANALDRELGTHEPCPTGAFKVWDRITVIDRKTLREHLQDLFSPGGPRVLAIDGPEASGKSHSGYLINYVGVKRAAALPVLVKLAEMLSHKLSENHAGPPKELEPYELMEAICHYLGLQIPPELRTARAQDARIVQKLLNWFAGAFPARREPVQPVWLIVDDLNFSACPPWVNDMMIGIAGRFARGQFDGLTVFLLGLGKSLLNVEARFFAVGETHQPLAQDDVWHYLLAGAAELGKPLPPEGRNEIMTRVWGNDPGPLRHEQLCEVVERANLLLEKLR